MKNWIIYFVRIMVTITLMYFAYFETGIATLLCLSLIGAGFESLVFYFHALNKKVADLEYKIKRVVK